MPVAKKYTIPVKVDNGVQIQHPISIGYEIFTPEIAEDILRTKNKQNRSLSASNVERYSMLMTSGEWDHENGEFIKFDKNGDVLDGQTRLASVIKKGTPQVLAVMRGLAPESRFRVDKGRNRSDAHDLQIRGFKDASASASIARIICQFDVLHGRPDLLTLEATNPYIPNGRAAIRAQSDPDVRAAITYAMDNHRSFLLLGRGAVGGLFYAFHKFGNDVDADTFMTHLRDATGPAGTSPALLRQKFLNAQAGYAQSRLPRNRAIKFTVHAYNLWVDGVTNRKELYEPKTLPRISSKVRSV